MGWSPHIQTSTQTFTNGVPDVGYEVMGQNFVYANYPTHSLYTHFMYKKRQTPSGADASFDYWDLYYTRKDYDNTWLSIHNTPGGVIKYKSGTWSDHATGTPDGVSMSGTTVTLSKNGVWGTFTSPYPSGPTVTSITVANEISSTRTFTVTHTGTLNSSDINYWINGNDITSLSSPNTPITNLQSTATGSTFDSYTLNRNGIHTIAIGSEYLSFYVSINIQATGSLTELNNAGLVLNFPTTETAWLELTGSGTESDGYDSVQLRSNGVMFRGTSTFNGSDRVEWLFVGTQYKSNVDPTLRGFFIETRTYLAYNNTWLQASEYIDPVAALESFGSPDVTILSGSGNHFTHFYFNFAQLAAQAPTTSNGGRKRRYPIISTNLFDRQKSIFSIGLTHKDETLF